MITPDQMAEACKEAALLVPLGAYSNEVLIPRLEAAMATLRAMQGKEQESAARPTIPPDAHEGECATDEYSRAVCEGMYADKVDDILGLVEALDAITTLAGGHSEQSARIRKIAEDAIKEHAAWTQR